MRRRHRRLRPRDECGIATIWAVTWIFVLSSVGWLGVMVTSIAGRQHHLDGAVDLVSLSAAARLQRGGDPCGVAAEIAAANRVDLRSCDVDGSDVIVTVETSMSLPFGLDGGLTATARAGP